MRGLRRLGRGLAGPALLGLVVLALATLAAAPAQAQEQGEILVSNLASDREFAEDRHYRAQKFRTGDHVRYTISGVVLELQATPTALLPLVVKIRENGDDDEPGNSVATLSVVRVYAEEYIKAAVTRTSYIAELSAPPGTVLKPNTTYWVEVSPVETIFANYIRTVIKPDSHVGIYADSLERASSGDDWETISSPVRMLLQGSWILNPDATLSALSLTLVTDDGDTSVELPPGGFSRDRLSYLVDAGSADTVTVRVRATANQAYAEVRIDTVNIYTDDIHHDDKNRDDFLSRTQTRTLTLRPDENAVRVSVLAASQNIRTYTVAFVFPDTTLSALSLALRPDEGGTAVALHPAFSSETTSYSATVANPVSQLRLTMALGHIAAGYVRVFADEDEYAHDRSRQGRRISEVNLREGFNSISLYVGVPGSEEARVYQLRVLRRGPPPRLVRATVSPRSVTDGRIVDSVYLQYDRALRPEGPGDRGDPLAPPPGAFAVTVNGSPVAVTDTAINGEYLTLRLARALGPGERQVAVSYTPPATNPVQTSIGGLALALTDLPVEIDITPFRPGTGGRTGTELLRASMTVQRDTVSNWAGYVDRTGGPSDARPIGSLSGAVFRFGGADHSVTQLTVNLAGRLTLGLGGMLTEEAAERLALHVGERKYRFRPEDREFEGGNGESRFTWDGRGLSLTEGDIVAVRIADANRPPVFRKGGASRRYLHETPGSAAGGSGEDTAMFGVGATDADGDALQYELMGRDAHLFTIDGDASWVRTRRTRSTTTRPRRGAARNPLPALPRPSAPATNWR